MLSVKRERFKRRYFVVVRDKGKIQARRKWNQKFTVRKAAAKFRRDNTFTEGLSKRRLLSRPDLTEIIDERKKPEIRKNIPFRVTVTGLLKDGALITASSQARLWDSRQQAKDAALESFWERVAQHFNQEYDAAEGMKFDNEVISMKSNTIMVV